MSGVQLGLYVWLFIWGITLMWRLIVRFLGW